MADDEIIIVCGAEQAKALSAEAVAELKDFARWLRISKPRPDFRAWRKERLCACGAYAGGCPGGADWCDARLRCPECGSTDHVAANCDMMG